MGTLMVIFIGIVWALTFREIFKPSNVEGLSDYPKSGLVAGAGGFTGPIAFMILLHLLSKSVSLWAIFLITLILPIMIWGILTIYRKNK